MEYRSATYNAVGTIDLKYNHPVYGWIPFTASPDDPEQLGRDLYALAAAGEVAPYVEPELGPLPPVSLHQIAGARLIVDQDNWEVTGVDRSTGISGAFLIDVDTVWVFFDNGQPDEMYEVIPSAGVTKHTDFVEVTRPALAELNFIVQRVQ